MRLVLIVAFSCGALIETLLRSSFVTQIGATGFVEKVKQKCGDNCSQICSNIVKLHLFRVYRRGV